MCVDVCWPHWPCGLHTELVSCSFWHSRALSHVCHAAYFIIYDLLLVFWDSCLLSGLRCGMSSQGHCQVVTAALFSNGIQSTNESVTFSSEMSCRSAPLGRCLPNGRAAGPRICHAHYTSMLKPLMWTCWEIEMCLDLLLYLPALDDPLFLSLPPSPLFLFLFQHSFRPDFLSTAHQLKKEGFKVSEPSFFS